jgi:4-aminobutyrate--pyruvate transaminase
LRAGRQVRELVAPIEPALLSQRDVAAVLHPWTDLAANERYGPTIIVRGSGVFVYDEHGRGYLEGIAGLWCASLGFGDEELIETAAAQMRRLSFYHSAIDKSSPPVIELCERLKEIAPGAMSKTFLTCTGSDANDTQLKLLWNFNNAVGRPAKKKVISRLGAYHGATIASASLCGDPRKQVDFDLPLPQVRFAGCPHYYRHAREGETELEFSTRLAAELDALILREGPDTVAAFIAEPVMGAGGVIPPPRGYFEQVQRVLARYDVRLIVDEVVCGFGRTGAPWGSNVYGIVPDSVTCAKALSAGYAPIAAVMVDETMYSALLERSATHGPLAHGFTFGGHPVPAAIALRVLELMEERDVLGHVRRVAPHFQRRLHGLLEHELVGEARGVGMLGAVELVADRDTRAPFPARLAIGNRCAAACRRNGLIVRALGDTIAICPPLIISAEEVDLLFDRLERGLRETAAGLRPAHRRAGPRQLGSRAGDRA